MRVLPVAFALSLALNTAALFSVSHVVRREESRTIEEIRIARQKEDDLQFEFVEARPKPNPERPKEARKISSQSSQNEDTTFDKANAETLPKTKLTGPTEQLEQMRSTDQTRSEQMKTIATGPRPVHPDELAMPMPKPEEEAAQASPASPPQAPLPTAMPQDKITTDEMSRTSSRGAKLYGLTSFEATGSGMGEYMKHLKEKIWLSWFPYLAFKYPKDFQGAEAILSFTISKQGEIKMVQILESQGSPLFATFCVEAVQRAGNFGPLPEEILALIGKDELEIRFGFHYH